MSMETRVYLGFILIIIGVFIAIKFKPLLGLIIAGIGSGLLSY